MSLFFLFETRPNAIKLHKCTINTSPMLEDIDRSSNVSKLTLYYKILN